MHNLLKQIGLGPQESRVYLMLLEKGERSASHLAKSLLMPRSTVRGLLDKLCGMELVRKIYRRNTQYYSCYPPEALRALLKEQEEQVKASHKALDSALDKLNALHESNNPQSKVHVFEGKKNMIEAFNHSLYQDCEEVLFVTSYAFLKQDFISKNDQSLYIPTRLKKGIKMRVLVDKDSSKQTIMGASPKELRERRAVNGSFPIPGNIHIYGRFVVFFTVQPEPMAILVENAQMAQSLKGMFECIWSVSS